MTQEITRRFGIDVGHRLLQHEGKCRNLHGHRYEIEVTVKGMSRLDSVGRVIDFGALKQEVGVWLDEVFDHGFVAQAGDPIIEFLKVHEQKTVVLDCPPSIENLARVWFDGAAHLLAEKGILVTRIKAWETPNCFAEYTYADARAADQRFNMKGKPHE